jgi:CubicO group peptidase (beta-lactamase class C family)
MRKILSIVFFILYNGIAIGQINLTKNQILKLDTIANQDVPKGAPGIATAIISNGKLIYKNYLGFENLKDSTIIDSNSRFNLASNGKQFTALAVLILEDEGKINFSDDIRKYLPNIFEGLNDKITIKNLLNHTSGIRDVYDLWSLQGITWWEQTYNNEDVVKLIQEQNDLNFSPNSNYLYSNTNYILLAKIIEKVTRKSFVEYTNEMFTKLTMDKTSFEDNCTDIQSPVAKAYFNFDTWTTYDWKWNVVGDGNFFSTLSDQIEWEKTVQGYGNPKISRDIIKQSQSLDSTNNNFKYSYGLEFGEHKGLPYRFHEGATGAWKATVLRFENNNLSIITMTNSGKTIPSMQTRQMADVVFNLKDNSNYIVTKPAKVGAFVDDNEILGVYLTPNNFSFEFKKKENGSMVLSRIGRGETELVREADNIFQQKYDPAFKQEFIKNDKGEMVVTAYYTSHAPYSLTRKKADWNNYDFRKINGQFVNDETNVELTIMHEGDKNYKVVLNGQESNGVLVTPNKLLVNNYVIEFEIEKNEISSFVLNSDRIKNVNFKRKI